jgi:hypothetical protein
MPVRRGGRHCNNAHIESKMRFRPAISPRRTEMLTRGPLTGGCPCAGQACRTRSPRDSPQSHQSPPPLWVLARCPGVCAQTLRSAPGSQNRLWVMAIHIVNVSMLLVYNHILSGLHPTHKEQ